MKSDRTDSADIRVTLRLSRNLDRRMRESAAFFGRSVGAEWRVAAEVYGRVLRLWLASVGEVSNSEAAGDEGVARKRLLIEICDGLVVSLVNTITY